jgi:sugar (pentulose or hexulose) kinase
MPSMAVVVLDIGKTVSKLSLWSQGCLLDRRTRPNRRDVGANPYLDTKGIEAWMGDVLADFARQTPIGAVMPVAHGAGAVVIAPDGTYLAPLDYEAALPEELATSYAGQRPPFEETGSPALPGGLNLGAQLHWLEAVAPARFSEGIIVTWAQFWAWRLCGVAATEVSSLGVHTDLWCPATAKPSSLAVARGWAARFAPLRRAGEVLGPVTQEWRQRTNLPADCLVYCGLHDSNADLLAVHTHALIGLAPEYSVVSTGTWFIAMRVGGSSVVLPPGRDCLFNSDVYGRAVPSARFMGGRETELLEETLPQLDPVVCAEALLTRAGALIDDCAMALPSFQDGVGPFPHHPGQWIDRPDDQLGRRAAAGLYLALMLDTCLDLIGTRELVVIGGRFQSDPIFTRTLAALRPREEIYTAPSGDSLCHGALSLIGPQHVPSAALLKVVPLPFDTSRYRTRWRQLLSQDVSGVVAEGLMGKSA